MLNEQTDPDDYILATCESASVKEFAERAFREAGYNDLEWQGEGSDEKLIDTQT